MSKSNFFYGKIYAVSFDRFLTGSVAEETSQTSHLADRAIRAADARNMSPGKQYCLSK